MSQAKHQPRVETRRRVLARVAIEAVYSRLARPYDWLSSVISLGQARAWQRALLPFVRGKRVLEVGMGTGSVQLDLSQAGLDVWGIDLSMAMMKQAVRKARKSGTLKRLKMCQARAQALPFPENSFDSVVSTFGSEYLTNAETYTEIARVLRKDGRLVLVPGGRLRSGQRSKAIKLLLTGKNKTNSSSRNEQMQIEAYPTDPAQAPAWVGRIMGFLEETGFAVSLQIGQNSRSTTLIIVGDKER